MKYLLYIALLISIITYSFWELFPKGYFYIGNAIFIFMICLYIFLKERNLFITFFLLCCATNNLVDEITGNWKELYFSETILLIIFMVIWLTKTQRNVR